MAGSEVPRYWCTPGEKMSDSDGTVDGVEILDDDLLAEMTEGVAASSGLGVRMSGDLSFSRCEREAFSCLAPPTFPSPPGPARTPLPVHEPTRSHMRPAETGLETETDTSPAETEHGIGAEHGIETDRGTDPVKRAVGMLPADPGLGEKVPVIMLTAANCDKSGPSLELPAAESGHGDGEADTPPSMAPPTPYCIGDIECRCADARIAPAGKSLKPAGLDTR